MQVGSKDMSEAFKRIEKSLKEAIAFAEGKDTKARVTIFNLQDLLLAAPTLTAEELQEFDRIREWMSQWSAYDG